MERSARLEVRRAKRHSASGCKRLNKKLDVCTGGCGPNVSQGTSFGQERYF